MRASALVVLLPLVLNGCTQFVAEAMADAAFLHAKLQQRVAENFRYRAWIRNKCFTNIQQEEDKQATLAQKNALLMKYYPPLLTFSVAKAATDDPTSIGSTAYICGPGKQPEE